MVHISIRLLRKSFRNAINRVIARPVARCLGPIENSCQPLANTPRRLRFAEPNRRKNPHDFWCANPFDREFTQKGKRVLFESIYPLLSVFLVSPSSLVLLMNSLSGISKKELAISSAPSFNQWIATLAGQLAILHRLLPGFSEGHKTGAAQPNVPPPTSDYGSEHPPFPARWRDHKVETVAVGISTRPSQVLYLYRSKAPFSVPSCFRTVLYIHDPTQLALN